MLLGAAVSILEMVRSFLGDLTQEYNQKIMIYNNQESSKSQRVRKSRFQNLDTSRMVEVG